MRGRLSYNQADGHIRDEDAKVTMSKSVLWARMTSSSVRNAENGVLDWAEV
jgi:hypothetical protein